MRLLVVIGLMFGTACAADWPQWMGEQRDGVWREDGILEKFPAGGPKVLWRTPIGAGYSGPAVVGDRVYVTDRILNDGVVRSKDNFKKGPLNGKERVLCLNRADGSEIWKHEYECAYDVQYASGPRTTPTVSGGKVYTLGTEGDLLCLDASNGKVLWEHNYKKDFTVTSPVWGFAASPLVDGQKLICLARGKGTTVVAYDKDSGKEIWRALEAPEPGYCPPVIYELNGKRQLIIWDPISLNGLDPESGKVFWTQPFTARAGLSISMPRKLLLADGSEALFITSFYNGSMLVKFVKDQEKPTVVWRGVKISEKDTDGLHSIMPTPLIEDGYVYGACSYGQFRCLKVESGERVWESFIPTGGPFPNPEGERWANTFIIKNGERVFLPNEKGDLISAKLSPKGYEEISRAHVLEPTNTALQRMVVWSHPAFAHKCMFIRNDKEIVCVALSKD